MPAKDNKGEVTSLLQAWSRGDETALERLTPLVMEELRRIAGRHMKKECPDHTLQPTALVNELYLKLVGCKSVNWKGRAHFFGSAAKTMRRVLVDHARARQAAKRHYGEKPMPLDEARDEIEEVDRELLALDEGLKNLAKLHERQSQVVEMHHFAGLSFKEISEVLEVSPKTVQRDWNAARAWLFDQIRPA